MTPDNRNSCHYCGHPVTVREARRYRGMFFHPRCKGNQADLDKARGY